MRTRTSVAILEKKNATLGKGGVDAQAAEKPDGAVDVEELKRLAKKRKATKKGKRKDKSPSDNFVPDDAANESKEKDADEIIRKRSNGILKINDNRNMVNNRRIAKNVPDVPTKGVDFNFEEHEARWKFICARNILPERYLSDITYNNQTYIDILEGAGMLALPADIGPH
ncbi:hypothetical protein LIER_19472 [Lithospermum erythrorhizon]|uniref:Uncharacterized protein n=1 Tax=Lithospermum erythrorhizon TaxID=34254 RepID=A0AAV3QJE3_LITER